MFPSSVENQYVLKLQMTKQVEMPWQVSKWLDQLDKPEDDVLRKAISDSWSHRDKDPGLAQEISAQKPASHCGSFEPPDSISDNLEELLHPFNQDITQEFMPDCEKAFMVDGAW